MRGFDDGAWMIKEWAAPDGRIHFAGDFTTLKTGWAKAHQACPAAARLDDQTASPEGGSKIMQELVLRALIRAFG